MESPFLMEEGPYLQSFGPCNNAEWAPIDKSCGGNRHPGVPHNRFFLNQATANVFMHC